MLKSTLLASIVMDILVLMAICLEEAAATWEAILRMEGRYSSFHAPLTMFLALSACPACLAIQDPPTTVKTCFMVE